MKDSLKTFPKIKVYSSDVAQWKKRIEKELREKLVLCEQMSCPIFAKIDGYPLCEFCARQEILGDE